MEIKIDDLTVAFPFKYVYKD